MAKFFCYEYIVSLFYQHVFTAPKETKQRGVTFAWATSPPLSAPSSRTPAGSLVSLMGKPANRGYRERVGHCSAADAGLWHVGADASWLGH